MLIPTNVHHKFVLRKNVFYFKTFIENSRNKSKVVFFWQNLFNKASFSINHIITIRSSQNWEDKDFTIPGDKFWNAWQILYLSSASLLWVVFLVILLTAPPYKIVKGIVVRLVWRQHTWGNMVKKKLSSSHFWFFLALCADAESC